MKGPRIEFGFLLIMALFAWAVLGIVKPAHAGDRLYPAIGLRYRMQDSEKPALRLEGALAFSAGRLAPSVVPSIGLDGRLSPGFDVTIRYRF